MTPGSDEAVKDGCTCPVFDNAHGQGYMGGVKGEDGLSVFVISVDCPLHGKHWFPWLQDGLSTPRKA